MLEGDVREHHSEQGHRGVDDGHAQGEGPGDGLAHRDAQVDGGGVVLQGAAARCAVGLQLHNPAAAHCYHGDGRHDSSVTTVMVVMTVLLSLVVMKV